MKKKLTIGLFLIMLAFTCQAQKIYSKEKLVKASTEDLNFYLEKAQKLKKTGGTLSIAGPVIFISGYGLASAAWSGGTQALWAIGYGMLIAGPIVTLVGLPMLIIGSSRIKNINDIKSTAFNCIKMDLAPSGIYNYATQNYQPGITLRIRF